MQPYPNKDNSPHFSKPSFLSQPTDSKDLIQKEILVNREEQNLLTKRLLLMNQLINDLPSTDPQYYTLLTQTHMDQIELDELKTREILLSQKLTM